jgi:NTP pyrophosphatase (non-canonical NTP hydrolase)
MELNKYQDLANKTAGNKEGFYSTLAIWSLGLTGESGEVADIIKKVVGHGHDLDREELKKELGDVLWYIASLSTELGFSLEEVAERNIDKLEKRYPDGFSYYRSQYRATD